METDTPTLGTDAGESAPVQETTAAPAVDRSNESVEEILGLGSYDKEPAETAVGATPPDAVEAKPDAPENPRLDDVPEDQPLQGLAPEELRRLLDKEPALRKFYFQERAYRELFPTVGEAREMRSMFPTVADAQGIVRQAEALLAAERTYRDRPEDFISGMAKGDPAAFERFAEVMPTALHAHDPALYRAKVAEPVVRSLIANMANKAAETNDEELGDALGVLVQRLGLRDDVPAATPAREPWRAEYEAMKRDSETRRQETVANFDASVQRTFVDGLRSKVMGVIQRLNPTMSEGAIGRVHGESVEAVVGKLVQNQWLSERAQALQRAGRYDAGHLNEMVSLLAKHADPLIAPTVSAVLGEWTNNIVKANARDLTESKRIAGKKEVGAGTDTARDADGRFKSTVKAGDPSYDKMTPDQILNMEI